MNTYCAGNYGNCNTVPQNEYGWSWFIKRLHKPFTGVCKETGDGWA